MSSKDDYKCWRTRGSDLDELAIYSWSLVSIKLTKRELVRRTVDKLLELSGWRSGQWESIESSEKVAQDMDDLQIKVGEI